MGERKVHTDTDREQLRQFTKSLLEDLQALERMLDGGLIESGVRRIGAEQEMFLVDHSMGPALKSQQILGSLNHPQFTTELALFNAEVNLRPQEFNGDCLWRMEQELEGLLARARRAADANDAYILLTGILPTLKRTHLSLDSMTPEPRYYQLNDAILKYRGDHFDLLIKGLDELRTRHDNVLFEASNTSFQIHFQVGPEEFAKLYNLAQVVAAPVLAAAVNSPVFLQHRLWSETRVALFQQSIDTRRDTQHLRQAPARIYFGDKWVDNSVLEIFREDIARFRVLIATDHEESPLEQLDRGEIPRLSALRLHNGTVYRWNRPCYGVQDGKAHIRIEHRALPAGPTIIDEMANAAFFFGLMTSLGEEVPDVRETMSFDKAKNNFMLAARYGLQARLDWIDGQSYGAARLLLDELIPRARAGLEMKSVRKIDIDRYMDVLAGRVESGRTGSNWILESLAGMSEEKPNVRTDHSYRAVTAAMYARQLTGRPCHEWDLASLGESSDWRDNYQTVGQVMTTDLFTVHPEDLVDLAANLMDWEHIRHVPVEDNDGRLVGLVSHRQLLRLVARGMRAGEAVPVSKIMTPDPITVKPDTPSLDAIEAMRKGRVSCLPVLDDDEKLVGIVTEIDFIDVAAKLLEEKLREERR